ncbi:MULTISPECIES: site-specific integrase [unclassified Afipia]|uniref:tyrosine-type recombinase/integrase n=1 Tax=unclassified Afipia TaxID=2642050 RepID=UPI000422B0B9|nr:MULTISPECIES: site-specific integrase [unclassified Afipia]
MARTLNKLPSNVLTQKLPPGRHADGGNLYLTVSPAGARSWVFLYRGPRSRKIEMGLGPARDVPLSMAREKATAARRLLAEGRSPLEAKRAEQAVPTFGDAADELIETMKPSWKNPKHRAQWEMTMLVYAASVRETRVDQVQTADVLRILRPLWQTKPETASRVRGRIERVLDSARAQGHRSGENPARWKGHLDQILPKRAKLTRGHHAAMPYSQVPEFVARLRSVPTISNLALEFTILCAARSGEARGALWTEIDRPGGLWIVPPARMKEGREHRVPLTQRALEILDLVARLAGKRQCELIFPGLKKQALADSSLAKPMFTLGASEYTPHGFRSSFRDWAGDTTDFAREVAEAALSHLVGDDSERAYRRGDALEKRRGLMIAWEQFLREPNETLSKVRHGIDLRFPLGTPKRSLDVREFQADS